MSIIKILNNELSYTFGAGIGQSRLSMFLLEKYHIGEVQSSLWTEKKEDMKSKGVVLL